MPRLSQVEIRRWTQTKDPMDAAAFRSRFEPKVERFKLAG
jgi:hypothetical protein